MRGMGDGTKWAPWVICMGAGTLLGLGFYTFQYAEGLSYLSNDPQACMNCHVMREHFDSWTRSSHHAVASCNDCHVPHHFPAKYVAKMENGWNHWKAQWRLDFVSAENSMGFHAPQEVARILAEAIDYARQGQLIAEGFPLREANHS
jgi:cytochrome c nitrite reductase small subunit